MTSANQGAALIVEKMMAHVKPYGMQVIRLPGA
jgi:hypothetical protein